MGISSFSLLYVHQTHTWQPSVFIQSDVFDGGGLYRLLIVIDFSDLVANRQFYRWATHLPFYYNDDFIVIIIMIQRSSIYLSALNSYIHWKKKKKNGLNFFCKRHLNGRNKMSAFNVILFIMKTWLYQGGIKSMLWDDDNVGMKNEWIYKKMWIYFFFTFKHFIGEHYL